MRISSLGFFFRASVALSVLGAVVSCETTVSFGDIYIETLPASQIGSDCAQLLGKLTCSSGELPSGLEFGAIYSDNFNLTQNGSNWEEASSLGEDKVFSLTVSGLKPGTEYFFRAYVKIGGKPKFGHISSFRTEASHEPGSGDGDNPGSGDGDNPGSGDGDNPGSGDGDEPGSGDGDNPGSGDGDEPGSGDGSSVLGKYYEMPGKIESDNLYYASHSFMMNGKKYRNYTVCFSKEDHCALWVAAPRHHCYSVNTVKRTDAYKIDPSIPADIQYLANEAGAGCNRGHILGSNERTCSREANQQVFYFSNIAPQLSSGFNTGGGGWNLLEDWVDTHEVADTLYEVIGVYYKEFTDGYGFKVSPKKIDYGGREDVSFPTMFYYALLRTKKGNSGKAVKDCSSDELMCAAFVRSHTNSLKGQRPSKTEIMTIAELEKITGFKYFVNVPQAPKNTVNPSDWGL